VSSAALNLFPMRILAIDPGLNTGWAAFNDKGFYFATGMIKEPGGLKGADLSHHINFFRTLKNKPQTIVCEQFRIRPGGETNGQRIIASEVIGVVRTFAVLNKIELVMSESKNLEPGCTFAGIDYKWFVRTSKTNHIKTNVPSAIAHGTFYAVENGIRTTSPVAGFKLIDPKSLA